MRVVYCIDTISRLGGTELITVAKANALSEIPGNQVWIAVANGGGTIMARLKNVALLDLGIHYFENDDKGGYWHALLDYMRKKRIHRQQAERMLNEIAPDVVISTGMSEKFFLPKLKIKSNPVFIREIHFSRHHRLDYVHNPYEWLVAIAGELRDYRFNIKKYDQIVVLTAADKTGSWRDWDKVTVIPNPIIRLTGRLSEGKNKVAISAGRLVWVKNFESLISIWAKVTERHPDWTLQIWGDGIERDNLELLIDRQKLKGRVMLMGYTADMQEKMSEASMFVFTSHSEGFSLATVEAMSVGLPVVAYNCHGGLRHVVREGVTGYLLPMGDEDAFAERVCMLIEHEELRKDMGRAAVEEAQQYRIEPIAQRWMTLFHDLLEKKRCKKK